MILPFDLYNLTIKKSQTSWSVFMAFLIAF